MTIGFYRMVVVLVLLAAIGMMLAPQLALVQAAGSPDSLKESFEFVEGKKGDLGVRSYPNIESFILVILGVVGTLIAVIALAALLYGAVLYITSLGDEGKTETAKKVIMYAVIGLLVLGAAGIVVNVVINLIKR